MASVEQDYENYNFRLSERATTFPIARKYHHYDYSEPPSPMTIPPDYSIAQLSRRFREHTLDPISTDSHSETDTSSSTPPSPAWSTVSSPSLTLTADSTVSPYPSTCDLTAESSAATNHSNSAIYHTRHLRQQRQRALRRQCSSAHLREIRALVERMASGKSEGNVAKTDSDAGSAVADDEAEMELDNVEEADNFCAAGAMEWRSSNYRRSFETGIDRRVPHISTRDVRIKKRVRKRACGATMR